MRREVSRNGSQHVSAAGSFAPIQEWRVKTFEDFSHAFIVRFWLEPREIRDAMPIWRGMIKHVPSGRQLYLKNFDEMVPFIESHINSAGVKLLERELD